MPSILNALSLGADPEGFLFDNMLERYVSSEGKLHGSKTAPLAVPGGAILEDNVTAEFNTAPVMYEDGEEAFVESIVRVRDTLRSIVKAQGLALHFKSVAEFPAEDLMSPQARESGCDPDYNLYTGESNSYPPLSETLNRFCGGHIHVGHPMILDNPRWLGLIVSSLDASVTAALLVKEGITERTSVYGEFGNFRPKPYGVEYRSAPNVWVDDEELIKFVREMTAVAIRDALHGEDWSGRVARLRRHVAGGSTRGLVDYMHPRAYAYGKERNWW